MILGTWNLEVYPAPRSVRGLAARQVLETYPINLWFLTELHADWRMAGYQLACSPPRAEAQPHQRKTAIATNWPMKPIPAKDNPAEGRLSLARVTDPTSGQTILAASSTLPWRGAAPLWRGILKQNVSYAEVYKHLLDHTVDRIHEEQRPGEPVIWGGDFNQGFYGRDYVGTRYGRALLTEAFESFHLQVPTTDVPALNEAHPAIDHIAIPADWATTSEVKVIRPERNGIFLSDHALYLIEADRSRASNSG